MKKLIIWWQMKLWDFKRLNSKQAKSGKRVTYKFDDDGTAVKISGEDNAEETIVMSTFAKWRELMEQQEQYLDNIMALMTKKDEAYTVIDHD
jgi:hypothetical protein